MKHEKQSKLLHQVEPEAELGFDPIRRLTKDMKEAAKSFTINEVQYLVTYYYQQQENRKMSGNQVRALSASEQPCLLLKWLEDQTRSLESRIKLALDIWTDNHPVGVWCKSIYGIGPIITAGLLAHINLKKAAVRDGVARTPLASDLWSYAGLANKEWLPKTKRPWNAELKTLCYKAGECFVKFSNNPKCFYGHLYRQRKDLETARNERGEFAEQAKLKLEKFKIGKNTDAYAAYSIGKLPPAHIHARARRYAVKIFLAHFYMRLFEHEFGKPAPAPYAISILGHGHMILPPE